MQASKGLSQWSHTGHTQFSQQAVRYEREAASRGSWLEPGDSGFSRVLSHMRGATTSCVSKFRTPRKNTSARPPLSAPSGEAQSSSDQSGMVGSSQPGARLASRPFPGQPAQASGLTLFYRQRTKTTRRLLSYQARVCLIEVQTRKAGKMGRQCFRVWKL